MLRENWADKNKRNWLIILIILGVLIILLVSLLVFYNFSSRNLNQGIEDNSNEEVVPEFEVYVISNDDDEDIPPKKASSESNNK